MKRSVLVSAGGDPLLLSFVVSLFRRYWYDEVDAMYVCYNGATDKVVVHELLGRLTGDRKIHIIYHPEGLWWGRPITELVSVAREDLVMLLEDDGFIYTPGKVREYFDIIESGKADAVGSPRMSCGPELADAMQRKYGLDYSGEGDRGPNYWPNFFFCKREDLTKTDMNFGSKGWNVGDYCKEVDHTFQTVTAGDTFVWADVQMRYNGVRFFDIPQYHASPYEIEYNKTGVFNWKDGPPPYLHGGSLSSGMVPNGYLLGGQKIPQDESGQMELETRCALWTIVSNAVPGFTGYKVGYKAGIESLIQQGLNRGNINKKIEIYKSLMHI